MSSDPDQLRRDAEDEIETWLCELDRTWKALLAEAEGQARVVLAAAEHEAQAIRAAARRDAESIRAESSDAAQRIVADADALAAQRLLEADAEFEHLRAIAAEHVEAIGALTAADVAAARAVDDEQLGALREAVQRLRAELSRVVDAAFDALPAMEATADAIDRALAEDDEPDEPTPAFDLVAAGPGEAGGQVARPGRLRRLWRFLT
jgi:hypothetical protein